MCLQVYGVPVNARREVGIVLSVEVVGPVVAYRIIHVCVFARIDHQVQVVDTVAARLCTVKSSVVIPCKHPVSEEVRALCALHVLPFSPFALPFDGVSLADGERVAEVVGGVHLQP